VLEEADTPSLLMPLCVFDDKKEIRKLT